MMTGALRTQLLIFSAVGISFAAVVIWNFYWPVDAIFDVTGYPLGRDFANVWSAPQVAAQSGVPALFDLDLYQRGVARLFGPSISPLMWSYPPNMLLLIWPFGHMPYWVAFAVWTLIGFAVYAAVVLARVVPCQFRAAFGFLLIAPATVVNVIVGQNGFFTAALMLGGVSLMEKRPWLAGMFFGLISVKPQLGLLIPIALLSVGAWRTIGGAALTVVVLLAASLVLWGLAPWQEWIGRIAPSTYQLVAEYRGFHGYMMASVFASMRDVGASPAFADGVQVIVSLLVIAATAVFFRRTNDVALRALVLTSGTLLTTPYSFNYDLTAITGAMLWLMTSPRPVRGSELALFGAVWVLPMAIYVLNGLHTGLAAWLIAGVYVLAIIRIREDRPNVIRASEADLVAASAYRNGSTL
jgi:hypothetical protein